MVVDTHSPTAALGNHVSRSTGGIRVIGEVLQKNQARNSTMLITTAITPHYPTPARNKNRSESSDSESSYQVHISLIAVIAVLLFPNPRPVSAISYRVLLCSQIDGLVVPP
ncbi:hypothetical protein PM082_000254 [Marasmius tenuissimus]|nr:hypothetical protein PM082_000254 [Marasmius tenuissimus]